MWIVARHGAVALLSLVLGAATPAPPPPDPPFLREIGSPQHPFGAAALSCDAHAVFAGRTLWTDAHGAFDLPSEGGTSGLPPGPIRLRAASADGHVIVGSLDSRHPLVWQAGHKPAVLWHPPEGRTEAMLVSHDGQTIIGLTWPTGAVRGSLTRWRGDGTHEVLPVTGVPQSVSNDGNTIYLTAHGLAGKSLFRWTAAEGATVLRHPAGELRDWLISGDGQVVLLGALENDAVTYTSAGTRKALPLTLPADCAFPTQSQLFHAVSRHDHGYLTGISDDGGVIAGELMCGGHLTAYRWTRAGAQSVRSWLLLSGLPEAGLPPAPGLGEWSGPLSPDGRIQIVVEKDDDQNAHTFLAHGH